jgi:transcriptional regulator GlxA family with amidase domain
VFPVPKVYIVAYEGCYASSLANTQDLYFVANAHWCEQHPRSEGLFQCQILSLDGESVTTASGLKIAVDSSLQDVEAGSILTIPAMNYPGGKLFNSKLAALQPITVWLNTQFAHDCIVCSHCTGSFLLAETGLLNGHQATTSWWLAEQFRSRYSDIQWSPDQLVVAAERLITGGANGAEMLAALMMVERYMGSAIASQCAKTLLVDTNLGQQAPFMVLQSQLDHHDALVLSVQSWLERNMSAPFSLTGLAAQFDVSSRTLIRRFKKAIGDTPNSYVQNLRIETTKKLLENTALNIETIMLQVGYADISSFSRLFQRKTGLSPRVYRQRCAYRGLAA